VSEHATRAIHERLAKVHASIDAACRRAGRAPSEVTLVAVSKLVSAELVRAATRAGQQLFGENYAQELRDKAAAVPEARWHFIGPLQRNKAKYVVGTAELIHSVDSAPLIAEIGRRALARGIEQRCLAQVNIAGEATKSGCAPGELPGLLDAFAAAPGVRCEGLMCIPPLDVDPRPLFRELRALAARHGLAQLSMGMSADYETAIEEGATLVRIGTAIFGPRP
jgi:pyridoxal phosphate enzyme (YggS family)